MQQGILQLFSLGERVQWRFDLERKKYLFERLATMENSFPTSVYKESQGRQLYGAK
jgi:hypothetical protein